MSQWFVTGTDTDVGKTRVAAALLYLARKRGLSTAALKPVAAGCEQTALGLRNDDAVRLQAQCQPPLAYQVVNPVALEPAIAPHIAADQAGVSLSLAKLVSAARALLARRADFSLIEGAGGWRVPLNERETLAELAMALELPVILVVGVRLGCLNHALLTAEAVERDGLRLAGWVANLVDPQSLCIEENIATLKGRLAAPCLGTVPYLPAAEAPDLAPYLDLDSLLSV